MDAKGKPCARRKLTGAGPGRQVAKVKGDAIEKYPQKFQPNEWPNQN